MRIKKILIGVLLSFSSVFGQQTIDLDTAIKIALQNNREIEIAKLIIKGNTYKEIASELFISEKTVTKHTQNMFEKANVSNKVGFINKLML